MPETFQPPSLQDITDSYTALEREGFPSRVSKCFQKVADELDCVILSRVPGKVCTTLIDEGYDLKPFYVKGKSCDWGPMAGFVCQLPALNKLGASNAAFNLHKHLESLELLKSKQEENEGRASDKKEDIAKSLFTPLRVSDARKNEILRDDSIAKGNIKYESLNSEHIIGIASDEEKSVLIEFLMKKEGDLWGLYHKNIYINEKGTLISYLKLIAGGKYAIQNQVQTKEGELDKYNQAIQEYSESLSDISQTLSEVSYNALYKKFNFLEPSESGLSDFYRISGIQSPYSPHKDKSNLHKNAVSGDYDLFAVWPLVPKSGFELTTRVSEKAEDFTDFYSDREFYFIPVETKPLALEIVRSRNVFIEIIIDPSFNQPDDGNINELVRQTAQTLNSLVSSIYSKDNYSIPGWQFPNRAFHGDEGGRPAAPPLEYPIACFVPGNDSLWNKIKGFDNEGKLSSFAFLIKNNVDFLYYINLLKRWFYIFLNDAWIVSLSCLLLGSEIDYQKDFEEKSWRGDKEYRKLQGKIEDPSARDELRNGLTDLLLGKVDQSDNEYTIILYTMLESFMSFAKDSILDHKKRFAKLLTISSKKGS